MDCVPMHCCLLVTKYQPCQDSARTRFPHSQLVLLSKLMEGR